MSSTFFPGLAGSALGLSGSECEPLGSAKLTRIAGGCCGSTGQLSLFGEISATLPAFLPMSSAGASLARTSVSPERARGWLGSAAAYGRSTPELLARYDRATSSWRTSQLCLDGGLELFSETWPRSGLMRNGIAYQLPPLVRLTDETGCGSLPTPTSGDSRNSRNATAT